MEFSFSASGLLLIYQLGVARTLQLANLHNEETCSRSTGSSGGSLVATALMLDTDIVAMKNFMIICMDHLKSKPAVNSFKLRHYIRGAFELVKVIEREKGKTVEVVKYEAIQKGRLAISVTGVNDFSNHLITEFRQQHELEEAILASCAIAPLGGFPFRLKREGDNKLNGKLCGDGGYTFIQPVTGDASAVVTVSPFTQWNSDIKPSEPTPLHWILHPPGTEQLEELFFLGMKDTLAYINREEVTEKFRSLVKHEKIIVGTELEALVKAECSQGSFMKYMENPVYQLRPDTSFEYLTRVTKEEKELLQHDVLRVSAFASVCAEFAVLAAANFTKSVLVGVETQRRRYFKPTNTGTSLRMWLPDSTLGTAFDSLTDSMSHAQKLLDPVAIWDEVSTAFTPYSEADAEAKMNSDEQRLEIIENTFVFKHFIA